MRRHLLLVLKILVLFTVAWTPKMTFAFKNDNPHHRTSVMEDVPVTDSDAESINIGLFESDGIEQNAGTDKVSMAEALPVSLSDVNCVWGSTRERVMASQVGGYKILQQNESNIIYSKVSKEQLVVYISYKFDNDGGLCASTLSMPENKFSRQFSEEAFAKYESEMCLEDGLEVKTEDTNLIAIDVSSNLKGGNIITIGFSYYEPLEDRDDCVDLGLSVRWGTCNLGATKPSGVGGFYAFSETRTKSEYWRENYSYCNNDANQYIFVYTNPKKDIGGTQYDAATKKLGDGWRMPNLAEVNELISKCTWERETVDGTIVYRITGPNGKSIVLPAIGWKKQNKDYAARLLHLGIGECLSTDSENAYILTTEKKGGKYRGSVQELWKAWGYNIRPVYTK